MHLFYLQKFGHKLMNTKNPEKYTYNDKNTHKDDDSKNRMSFERQLWSLNKDKC